MRQRRVSTAVSSSVLSGRYSWANPTVLAGAQKWRRRRGLYGWVPAELADRGGDVARGGHAAVPGQVGDSTVHVGGGRGRPAQRDPFDRLDQVLGQPASPDVAAGLPLQLGGRRVGAVDGGPAPHGVDGQPSGRGEPGQRDPVVQVLADQRGLGFRTQLRHDRHRPRDCDAGSDDALAPRSFTCR